jgi:hypothetical protein
VRATQLAIGLAEGMAGAPDEVDSVIMTTRTVGNVDLTAVGLAAAAKARVAEAPAEACLLQAELERFPGIRGSSYHARQLPGMIRTALVAGDPVLGEARRRDRATLPARAARPTRGPSAARRVRGRRGWSDRRLLRGSRWLGRVRQRPRTRLRAPRSRPLPHQPRRPRCRAATPHRARAVLVNGLRGLSRKQTRCSTKPKQPRPDIRPL